MFNTPKRLTANTKALFESEVMAYVAGAMKRHEVTGRLKVTALRGNRGIFPSVQIFDSPENAKNHYELAQELKQNGIGTAMLYFFSKPDGTAFSEMFYPMDRTALRPTN